LDRETLVRLRLSTIPAAGKIPTTDEKETSHVTAKRPPSAGYANPTFAGGDAKNAKITFYGFDSVWRSWRSSP
jgi:hypothetical protein